MKPAAILAVGIASSTLLGLTIARADQAPPKTDKPATAIKYGDGKADGKKSIAGTGEMIEFTLPNESQQLRGLRIHGARYGYPQAPDEDVEVTIVDKPEEDADVVATEFVPYKVFQRGKSRWTTIKFDEPIEVPQTFWVVLNFNAEQTKGVYVSYDTETEGKYSRIGLPGAESEEVDFGGDWMIQALLTKPE